MLYGHGDDFYNAKNEVKINFSSNVWHGANLDKLKEHLIEHFEKLTRYPEPDAATLKRLLARRYEIKEENIVVSNGSITAFYLLAQAWRGAKSMIAIPSFSEYEDACRLHEHEISFFPTSDDLSELSLEGQDFCWICNPNNPDGKLNKVAENVWKEYVKGNADGHIGCQLIFSDIGTPGPDKDFTIYDYLKESLIKYGIPAEEIAFIHDAKTDAQRDALFKEMRTGKKKVLIGSTDKCGTGVNVQTHLVAMHHVDCPWKPSSIEQREGRGIRQGNENEEVAVSYTHLTLPTT